MTERECCEANTEDNLQWCEEEEECLRCCGDDLYCGERCVDPLELDHGVNPLPNPNDEELPEECCYGAGCCDEFDIYFPVQDYCCLKNSEPAIVNFPKGSDEFVTIDCCESGTVWCPKREECIPVGDLCCEEDE